MNQLTTIKEMVIGHVQFDGDIVKSLRKKYSGTHVSDWKDKTQVDLLTSAWREVRQNRLDLEKKKKAAAEIISSARTELNSFVDPVVGDLKSLEGELKDEINRVEQAKIDEELAIQAEKERRFAERTNQLFNNGFSYNGVNYVQGVVQYTPEAIDAFSDDEWITVVSNAEKGHAEIERARKAEKERIAKLEAIAKQQAEKEAEEQRLEAKRIAEEQRALDKWKEFKKNEPVEVKSETGDGDDDSEMPFGPPSQSFPVPEVKTAPIVENVPAKLSEYRPAGYSMGFDACKTQVLSILRNTGPMKRSELISMVQSLNSKD